MWALYTGAPRALAKVARRQHGCVALTRLKRLGLAVGGFVQVHFPCPKPPRLMLGYRVARFTWRDVVLFPRDAMRRCPPR